MPVLSGMLFCSDYGAKQYQVRAKGWRHEQEHYVCATYRKIKGGCSSHQIHNVQVEEILLKEIRKITAYAREQEDKFVELVTKQSKKELNQQLRNSHKEPEQVATIITKLDTIIQILYEDNIDSKISDERFMILSSAYDKKQAELTEKVTALEKFISELLKRV